MSGPAKASADRVKRFDPTDLAVLRMISSGMTLQSIARRLGCSERTVRRRAREICVEMEVGTPIEAVVLAVRRGLI